MRRTTQIEKYKRNNFFLLAKQRQSNKNSITSMGNIMPAAEVPLSLEDQKTERDSKENT
jgi:hypothetical protein